MLFKNITIVDENGQQYNNHYLATEKDTIAYMGKDAPSENFGREYDGEGKILIPGFYNAHAHSPMTLLRGYGENLSLEDWLQKRIFPYEAQLDNNAVYYSTLLAMAESLKFGIISTSDMYYFCEDMIRAVQESKAKMNISRAITSFGNDNLTDMDSYKEAVDIFNRYNGAENNRIVVEMSVHAEYTSNEKTVRALAEKTKEMNAGMHVHISETKKEHEECKERFNGKTPVQYFNDLGLFDVRTTAAHCVWVDQADMDILAEKNVSVASCPISNMKLASGFCDTPKMIKKGINVAIGTDSVASNNKLDMIDEMKTFALVNKGAQLDPTLITPQQAIYAATAAGAKAQGRIDCGEIKVGKKADLVILDATQPNMNPVHDQVNNIVYSASGGDVITTIVDGEILYDRGEFKTIDIEKVIHETNKANERILEKLK